MSFVENMEHVVHGFEAVGVAILVLGSLMASLSAVSAVGRVGGGAAYQQARRDIGRAILLGLEWLIIADIVQTITVDATLKSTLILGLVVLVRTFLSFSLEVELEGSLPWRKAALQTAPPVGGP